MTKDEKRQQIFTYVSINDFELIYSISLLKQFRLLIHKPGRKEMFVTGMSDDEVIEKMWELIYAKKDNKMAEGIESV